MKNLRILYLPIWYPDSINKLAGNFIYDLAHDVADTNHEIDVFYPNFTFNQRGDATVTVNKYDHLNEYLCHGWSPPKKWRLGLETWISKSVRVAKKHLTGKYDIIHTHGYVASFLGPKFQEVFGGKLVVSLHHSSFLDGGISAFRSRKLKTTIRRFDKVIVPSNVMLNSLTKKVDLNITPLLIPNYININKINLKNQNDKNNNIINCLAVGSLISVKGFDTLIEKWSELPLSFHLVIVGNGPMQKRLTLQIDKLKLAARVKIIDKQPKKQLLNIYSKYDIFVSMSKVETFGMCMLEAIAAGIPVVTSTDTGPRTFVNEKNGIISSKNQFVESLISIAENLDYYEPLKLRKSIIPFDKSNIVTQVRKVYRNLKNNPPN